MKIFLGDLGHYTIKLTNNHTPINIGFIAGYAKKHLGSQADIRLFKDPGRLIDEIEKNPPDILALSNYVWCQAVSEEMFKFYKRRNKNGVAVWGGPNFPMNELHKAKPYLLQRPYIDFYVPFEGEIPFLRIAEMVLRHGFHAPALKDTCGDCLEGAFFISKEGELIGNQIGIQIPDLSTIPSPYLDGWMDEFLAEGLHAMFETQRGCPYKCAYCHTGLDYYNRGRAFSLERCKQEIEYITETVKDPTKTHLYITDSNFGMWPQDLEFSKWLCGHYEKTGFPLSFGTSTGKGQVHRVLETVMSHPKLMLTNSVQSLDDKVLKVIQRKNLPFDHLRYSQQELDHQGKLSQPEIILGLPEETRQSHLETLRKLMQDIGANIIYQYTLMLLPGTKIYTDKMREEYRYMVKYRLLPTSFGEYKGQRCFEFEEVSVATKDLSFEDYLQMREIFFFVHNVYSNAIYRPLLRYLIYLKDDIVDFFLFLMKKRKSLGPAFPNRVLEDYLRDTQEELFDSREELIQYYSQDHNYQDLREGKKGKNLTHTYRAVVLLNVREWASFIANSFREYMQQKYPHHAGVERMANSVIVHLMAQAECQYRYFRDRKSIPTRETPLMAELNFDIPGLFAQKITQETHPDIPEGKFSYSFYMKDEAVRYMASYPEDIRVVDLALLVLRMDQSYLFPLCVKNMCIPAPLPSA